MFDGDAAAGPVPILFAANPEATAAANENVDFTIVYLAKIFFKFFVIF
jgi:hypothetical protein